MTPFSNANNTVNLGKFWQKNNLLEDFLMALLFDNFFNNTAFSRIFPPSSSYYMLHAVFGQTEQCFVKAKAR